MSHTTRALEKIFNRLVVPKINNLFAEFGLKDNMSLTVQDKESIEIGYTHDDEDEVIEGDFSVYKINVVFKDDSIFSYRLALHEISYMLLDISTYVVSNPYYTLKIYFDDEMGNYNEDVNYHFTYTSTGDKKSFQKSFSDFEGIIYQNF